MQKLIRFDWAIKTLLAHGMAPEAASVCTELSEQEIAALGQEAS